MRQDVKKYIDSELEVSRLRIESLQKSGSLSEAAISRLIEIERFFQAIDFEALSFSSISEAMTAVRLFRSSKKDFTKLYLDKAESVEFEILESILEYKQSIMQNLLDEDSSCVSTKNKIRKLILLESSLKLFKALKEKLSLLKEEASVNKIFLEFMDHYQNEIFGFYNESLKEVLSHLSSQGKQIYKINGLSDIISSCHSTSFDFKFQKIISHGKITRGIVLPVRHLGRETSWVCFKKIVISGIDFSEIFSYTLKNVTYEGKYYKAMILRDKKELLEDSELLSKYQILSNLFYQNALDEKKTQSIGLSLDLDKSKILIPASRTDDDSLRESWHTFLVDFKQIINGVKI